MSNGVQYGAGGTQFTGTGAGPAPCTIDGGTACLANASFPAADATGLAAKIVSGNTVAGVAGSYSPDYPEASSVLSSDTTGGVAGTILDRGTWDLTTSFPGAGYYSAISNAPAAGDLKRAIQVNGVTGNFPSSTSPLPRYSSASGASTTTSGADENDLDLATFDAKIKASGTFEYWDSNGQRYEDTGDADIQEANIATGTNIFGTEGSAGGVNGLRFPY